MTYLKKKFVYWYRKYTPESIKKSIHNFKSKNIKRHLFFFKLKVRTTNYKKTGFEHAELNELEKISEKISLNNYFYVDIGASDGFSSSSTYGFAKSKDWTGLSFEVDELKFAKMSYIYKKFKNVNVKKELVTPTNVGKIFKDNNVPKSFGVLNIDIDSYDYFVLASIIDDGFRPSLISIEINEKIPPPIQFTVLYDINHFYNADDFYGCSISKVYNYLIKKDYFLYKLLYNNAIFIEVSHISKFMPLNDLEGYKEGYVDQENKYDLFKYNQKYDHVIFDSAENNIKFFKNLFKDYDGKYEMYE